MAKEVTCPPCGEVIRGEDDAALIANVRSHIAANGHEMPAGMTDEQFEAHVLGDSREAAAV
jgi:hypothetical protein